MEYNLDKIAVYTGSSNIYDDMVTCAKSLVAHSDVDKIHFLIEDDDFPFDIPSDLIETRNVSKQEYFDYWGPNMKSKFTYFAMMRAALAYEFKDYSRILSMDCDTICIRDVSHIWELPIDDYYFAASREAHRSIAGMLYTNVGVALMNLDKQRINNKAAEYIDVLNRQKFDYIDQDVMNYLSQGYIYDMNSEFNANEWTNPCQNPRVLHFAGVSRDLWHRHPKAKLYKNMSWDKVMVERKHNLAYPG